MLVLHLSPIYPPFAGVEGAVAMLSEKHDTMVDMQTGRISVWDAQRRAKSRAKLAASALRIA